MTKPFTWSHIISVSSLPPEKLARACARLATDKKAEDLIVLDLRGISTFTDFFVICSGTSDPHLKAIASNIREGIREETGESPLAVDGYPASQWMIIDYTQVIIHVFQASKRDYYDLEALWSDAPRLDVSEFMAVAK